MLFNDMFSLLNYVKLKVLGLKLKKLFFYNKKNWCLHIHQLYIHVYLLRVHILTNIAGISLQDERKLNLI